MKYTWILPLLVGGMLTSPSAWSSQRNQCDSYYERGFPSEVIETCQEQHGVSEWFNAQMQERAEATQKSLLERQEREALENAIVEQTFDREDLKNALGFGALDIVAYEITYSGFQSNRERMTTADRICRELGFEKPVSAYLSEETPGGQLSGGAHFFKTRESSLFRSQKDFEADAWDWEGSKNAKIFEEVTCIRSDIEDNELLENIGFIEEVLDETYEPITPEIVAEEDDNTYDVQVNDTPRYARPTSPDRVQNDLLDYFDSRGSGGSDR